MPLPKFSRRSGAAPAAADPDPLRSGEPGAVQAARVQARRRLLGAVVLLGLGVVLFPLLFETQPRPLPSDVPIQVARRDAGSVVTVPALQGTAASAPAPGTSPLLSSAPAASVGAVEAPPVGVPPTMTPTAATTPSPSASRPAVAASAVRSVPPVKPPAEAASRPAPTAAPAPAARSASAPAPMSVPKPAPRSPAAEAPRVASPPLSAASAPAGRFVIQVGAFSDPIALRDARARVEKLGLRTFTQDVETPAGRRTRVRVGPFETREQADGAAARLKAAGLPAYILTP